MSQKSKKQSSWTNPPFGKVGQLIGLILVLSVLFKMFGGSPGIELQVRTEFEPQPITQDNINLERTIIKTPSREKTFATVDTIKEVSFTIDRISTSYAQLDPVSITIMNTGNVPVSLRSRIAAKGAEGTICDAAPMMDYIEPISPGETQKEAIRIIGCQFKHNGAYQIKVTLLDEDGTVLKEVEKPFTLDDPAIRQREQACSQLRAMCSKGHCDETDLETAGC